MRSIRRFGLALLALVICAQTASAAVINGSIKAIDAEARTLELEFTNGTTKSFELPDTVRFFNLTKPAKIDVLEEGQSITITTNKDNRVTDVRVKKASLTKPKGSTSKSSTEGARSGGWTQYGGPNRDNRSTETGLIKSWPPEGPKLAATGRNLGIGYSSVSLADGKVLTMGSRGTDEYIICLDEKTLDEAWSVRIGRTRPDGQGGGPRGTPTIDGDLVYSLGANGDLACLKLASGEQVWSGNILSEFGANNIVWGISESPLIDGDKLIVTPGGRGAAMVALNKNSGKTLWKAEVPGNPQTGYSSAIIVETGGVKQYVNFVHSGVVGIRADTGAFLWGNESSANGTANCSSPVEWDGNVFSASGYGTGGALVKLTGNRNGVTASLAYHTDEMKNHHGGMVVHEGYIYGTDEEVLKCLEVETGKVMWQNRSVGKGAVVYGDGMIVLRAEGDEVALFEASPKAYNEKGRFRPTNRTDRPAWPHPVIANGKLWLRDQEMLATYDLK
jgi:outer membrane protein assembly factor BamB